MSYEFIRAQLGHMRHLSAHLKCECEPVPFKEHGKPARLVCPQGCPHERLDAAIANTMVEAEHYMEKVMREKNFKMALSAVLGLLAGVVLGHFIGWWAIAVFFVLVVCVVGWWI